MKSTTIIATIALLVLVIYIGVNTVQAESIAERLQAHENRVAYCKELGPSIDRQNSIYESLGFWDKIKVGTAFLQSDIDNYNRICVV